MIAFTSSPIHEQTSAGASHKVHWTNNHWINNPIFGLIDTDGVSPLPDAVWSQTAKIREAVLETIAT